jgi:nucleotide-binding universal stress UspA family protein
MISPREAMFLSVIDAGTSEGLHIAEGYLLSEADELQPNNKGGDAAIPDLTCTAIRPPQEDVAGAILQFAEDNGCDLIMLAAYGRSGVNRWLMGSVAEKVIRRADMLVFLVSGPSLAHASIQLKRLLVPLKDDLNSYLTSIVAGLASVDIKAQPKVRLGHHPAEQITEEAQEGSADLTVMYSHGHTGLVRWAFGSIADQVLHPER